MAITYPLTPPTSPRVQSIIFTAMNRVAVTESPFTYSTDSQAFPGQRWAADVTLPPMRREQAAQWVSFLVSLRGSFGDFLLGNPMACVARGVGGGSPVVSGASQTGSDLNITGATASTTGWLKAGDYIQLGASGTARLHQVLQDANTDGSGATTLTLWPHVQSPVDSSVVIYVNPVGKFKLSSPDTSWSIDSMAVYGLTFSAKGVV
jgi:hypothetical protein